MAELVIRRGLEEPDTSGTFVPHKPQRPDKVEGGKPFRIVSEYSPAGDQPGAIADLKADNWHAAAHGIMTTDTVAKAASRRLDVGGKTDMPALGLKGRPLRLTGVVERLTDGEYTVTGPMFTGVRQSLGRTAVLRVGTVLVFICERPQEPYDTGVFTHAGVDPAQSRYVLLKSRQHFRAGFGPFARHVVLVSGPGVCSSDYDLFPFKHLSRPMYPLDADATPAHADGWAPACA